MLSNTKRNEPAHGRSCLLIQDECPAATDAAAMWSRSPGCQPRQPTPSHFNIQGPPSYFVTVRRVMSPAWHVRSCQGRARWHRSVRHCKSSSSKTSACQPAKCTQYLEQNSPGCTTGWSPNGIMIGAANNRCLRGMYRNTIPLHPAASSQL